MPGQPSRFSGPCVRPPNRDIQNLGRDLYRTSHLLSSDDLELTLGVGIQLLVRLKQESSIGRLHLGRVKGWANEKRTTGISTLHGRVARATA